MKKQKLNMFFDPGVDFSDVSLSGTRSYIKMKIMILGDVHFNLEFEVRPMHPKGLLFYVETHDGCFISLSLQGGLLEYRWTGIDNLYIFENVTQTVIIR